MFRCQAVRSVSFLRFPVLLILGFLSACASDSPQKRAAQAQKTTQRLAQIPTVDISSRLYSQALDLKSDGDCDKAIPLFHRLAMRGQGFELAQYHLADCLLMTAPSSATDTSWLEALLWMRRAAEAGAPEAQGRLAALYAIGPENARNLVEAAMWYHLFQVNPARKKPGFSSRMSETEKTRIETAIGAKAMQDGKNRAANFSRIYWTPPGSPKAQDTTPRDDGGIELLNPREKPRDGRRRD